MRIQTAKPALEIENAPEAEDWANPEAGIVMDQEDAARADYRLGYRDAGKTFLTFLGDLYNVRQIYSVSPDFFLACLMAAIGRWDLLHPLDSQVAIANFFRCTKANTNKLVIDIQTRLRLPSHRSEDGRRKMSDKRKGQQKGKMP